MFWRFWKVDAVKPHQLSKIASIRKLKDEWAYAHSSFSFREFAWDREASIA